MNRIEKSIYNFVKRNPKVKNFVRDTYQSLCSIVPFQPKIINDSLVNRSGYFFGFHDKSPWSYDDSYLLANKFTIPNRNITSNDSIEVGVFSGRNFENFIPLAKTNSFNWQQGCMLQWVGKKNEIIFNSFDGAKHISTIINLQGNIIKTHPIPISAVDPIGKNGLSYSFTRLARYAPGYGYENGHDEESDVRIPNKQGLMLIDLESGSIKKLFTVAAIASIDPDESMDHAFHYFTHCLFSPSGNKFVFFHRWIRDMNFVKTRMFSCDLNGENLFQFPTNGMVSHIGWKDEEHILAYCSTKKYGDCYTLLKDGSDHYHPVGKEQLNVDGHPSYSPKENNLFVTNTYPNRFRISELFLFDSLRNKKHSLAKLKQPLQFKNELRCDLHPRWNRSGTMICFDSAHTGRRSQCTLTINNEML